MNRDLLIASILIVIIVVITLLSASNIGFHMTRQTAPSIAKSQMIVIQREGEPYPPIQKGIPVQVITASNSIIPRRLPLGQAHGCLYNPLEQGVDVQMRYDYPATMPSREFEIPPGEIIDIGIGETKTVTLSVIPYVVWEPRAGPKQQPQNFDTLYIFISDEEDYFYPQCYNLPAEQQAKAIKIPLV